LGFLIGIFFKQQAKISISFNSAVTTETFLIKNRTDIFIKTDPAIPVAATGNGINNEAKYNDAMKKCHVDGRLSCLKIQNSW
jgi:hypothetical protein